MFGGNGILELLRAVVAAKVEMGRKTMRYWERA